MQALNDSLAKGVMNNDLERLLFLADFSFALMSSEFLYRINSLGTVPDDDDPRWDTLSLQVAYELANAQGIALHCGHRTSFLLRLMDRLMPRPYFTVAVPGKHFFPVVMADTIAGLWFIVDPYDPFIITDDSLLLHLPAGRRDWCGAIALYDSVADSNPHARQLLSFNLENACRTTGVGGYRYAVPDLGRPDTFHFNNFFDPIRSHYIGKNAIASVPPRHETP